MVRSFTLAVFLVGCKGDADGDGLTNKEEKDLGTDRDKVDSDGDGLHDADEIDAGADPLRPDTDGDGLNDGEEDELGSSPVQIDSDEDTYGDFDEVQEGSDPADPDDRIYKGYWPYNPNKEAVDLSPWTGGPVTIGETLGRFANGKDQFRDEVDIRDFAGLGKMVVIDASATWCVPCQNTAAWLSRGAADDVYGYEGPYGLVRRAVDKGDLFWLTFMTDNDTGTEIVVSDVKGWDELFPNEKVPVITDVDQTILMAVNLEEPYLIWPSFVVVDENLEVVFRGGGDQTLAFLVTAL
jgi:hypothetical protein